MMSQEETTVKRKVGRPTNPNTNRSLTQMQVTPKCAERIRIIAAVHNMNIPLVIESMVNLHYAELVTQGIVPEDMTFTSRIKESIN